MDVSLYRGFAALHAFALSLFPESQQWSLRARLREHLRHIETVKLPSGVTMSVVCDHPQVRSRVQRLYTKEPETIKWLDRLKETDVLWDIGANIGIYSLYAALEKGARVMAFEPMRENIEVLQANIRKNNIGDRISVIPVAASDKEALGKFFLRNINAGSSGHQFGENFDQDGNEFKPAGIETILAARLDCLSDVFGLPTPTHIKIDVDGIEQKVILGAHALLQKPELKSVLVEVNKGMDRMNKDLLESGFSMTSKDGHNCIFDRVVHAI